MTARHVGWIVALVASWCLLESAAVSAQPCPQSCIYMAGPTVCFPVAAKDSVGNQTGRFLRAGYDLVDGTVVAQASSAVPQTRVEVSARDVYTVVGPPAGTEVSFKARMSVRGYGNRMCGTQHCGWFVFASEILDVESGSSDVETGSSATNWQPNRILELPLTKFVGQPFEMHWRLFTEASADDGLYGADASQEGVVQFLMPEGASIQSCWGFDPSGVVPAQRTSWGTLKVLYR